MGDFTITEGIVPIRNAKEFDPVVAAEIFNRLAKEHGGSFEAEEAWKEAENNPSHPHYKHYDWNLREAAEKHWTGQARQLIRLVSITLPNMPKPTRAFVSIARPTGKRDYHPVVEVIKSEDFFMRLLAQALKDAEALVARYNMYKELHEVTQAAKKTAEAAKKQHDEYVSKRRKRLDGDQPSA